VTQPPPPPPPPPAGPTDEELFVQNIKDIYFDYDKADLRADQDAALQADMLFLNQHPNINFTIEGHCDERGSAEYNLALGDKRATAREALAAALSTLTVDGAPRELDTVTEERRDPHKNQILHRCSQRIFWLYSNEPKPRRIHHRIEWR
jgi:outer membrane protein OmpA-like peptidoglycan-associated protein